MKIDMPSIYAVNNYKINSTKPISPAKAQTVAQKDDSNFSNDATLFADVLRNVKSMINERINTPAANLEGINEAVKDNSYGVNTQDLAINILLNK